MNKELVSLAQTAGGLFDSVAEHGAMSDTFFFSPEALQKLVDMLRQGTIVGYQCQSYAKGPWVLIELDDYERVKTREGYSFRPVRVAPTELGTLIALSKITRMSEHCDIKINRVSEGKFMVCAYPPTELYGALWWFEVDASLVDALERLYAKGVKLKIKGFIDAA